MGLWPRHLISNPNPNKLNAKFLRRNHVKRIPTTILSVHVNSQAWQICWQNKKEVGDLKSLPWQWASVEVHKNISQWLKIVTPALFTAQMCVDTGIPRRTGQVLIIAVRNVVMCVTVDVLLGQPKIYQKHLQYMSRVIHSVRNAVYTV